MAHRSKRGGIAEHLDTHSEAGEWYGSGKSRSLRPMFCKPRVTQRSVRPADRRWP